MNTQKSHAAQAVTRSISQKVSAGSLQGYLEASRVASAWKVRHRDMQNAF